MMMKKVLILLIVLWRCVTSSAFAFTNSTQPATLPSYQFRSTSTCQSVIGQSALAPSVSYVPGSTTQTHSPYRAKKWDDPDEDPMGEIPIGSPWILLVLAVLYALLRYYKPRLAKK